MKVAVIGSGGREHAVVKKLRESARCDEIIAIPGNAGMSQDALCEPIKATDIEDVVAFCVNEKVDYVVVTPDDPLALGMVDALAEMGIPSFGPSKQAARIEASKVFSKRLMEKYNIPTASHKSFSASSAAIEDLQLRSKFPVVVKADGLALGKGVYICNDYIEAKNAVLSIMEEKRFGDSGAQVVIEEFLTGPEVSVLAFCDGDTLVPMVSSMDHKRALDGDEGPNTGGMGAVAPNPFYTEKIAEKCMNDIFIPTVEAMKAEGAPFKGCLYFGLMLTPDGPKVIEYNCRFGDPETQVVLPLLRSDLLEIMLACTEGRLKPGMVRFADEAAACVVMASGGYPGEYKTGMPITIFQKGAQDNIELYFAGVAHKEGELCTAGGRVLGVSAVAPSLQEAVADAYAAVRHIHFKGEHYRKDIGKQALEQLAKTE